MHETPLEQSLRGSQPCHTSDIFVLDTVLILIQRPLGTRSSACSVSG
jgi:hypothetical protein